MHGRAFGDQPRALYQTRDRMSFFLAFSTSVLEDTTLHRLCGCGHPGLYNFLRRKSIDLFIDGTFRLVPQPFTQLLILMVRDMNHDHYLPDFLRVDDGENHFLVEVSSLG
uniref:Uncharacterized protein n=1 Tax=Spongospora subterranea TaxID=70186 RepID=A0A0H5QMM8_9EUKA|eukprot:CRZ03253.1 hypothetical protein [Spongospora subterranea]